jgi:ribosomal protein uS17
MDRRATNPVGHIRQLWRQCAAGLRAFAADRRGTVITFMAVAIVPLIGALGLATDAARGYMVRSQLSSALDAAALAGGKVMFSANRDADIAMFYKANFPDGYMGATVTGPVISDNADKTLVVRVDIARRHKRYHKILRHSMTLSVHDERNDAHEGDTVRVQECRPMSRTKRWRLLDVLERAR